MVAAVAKLRNFRPCSLHRTTIPSCFASRHILTRVLFVILEFVIVKWLWCKSGSRSVLNFEEMNSLIQQDEEEELDEFFHQPGKKRRLTVDQVQFLERSFEVENKLEPERKLQLAKDLNLQPRQVAIWFQNRRARWKTKQLEKDYDGLLASFNTLQNEYDLVLKEKEKLKLEVEKLKNKLIAKGNGVLKGEEGLDDNVQSKSDNYDSDSPHCAEGVNVTVDSSHNLEQEQSDLSQDEDDGFKKGLLNLPCVFPKLEDAVYSGFEDSSFWSWSFG